MHICTDLEAFIVFQEFWLIWFLCPMSLCPMSVSLFSVSAAAQSELGKVDLARIDYHRLNPFMFDILMLFWTFCSPICISFFSNQSIHMKKIFLITYNYTYILIYYIYLYILVFGNMEWLIFQQYRMWLWIKVWNLHVIETIQVYTVRCLSNVQLLKACQNSGQLHKTS